jgi:gamma-glutamylputrescine oxidase
MVSEAPDWGTPPWRIDAEIPERSLPAHVQACVVGGGFTGLSAAHALARRGIDVALLEARRIGAGASGRTGGIALEGTAAGPLERVGDCLPTLARLVEEADIDCELRLDGCWELAHRPCTQALWRDGGQDLSVVATVAGGTLDPGALVSGLACAAMRAGATIHERADVRELVPGSPSIVRVGDRVLRAEHVILALNAYTPGLLAATRDVTPVLTLALATAPLDDATLAAIGLGARLPFYTQDLPYLWGRVLDDGRMILGAGLAFDPEGALGRIDVRSGEAAAALADLEARVRGFHPALKDVGITARWGGPIAFRRSRTPLLARHPEAADVIVTGAYAGHGVALSVRAGALAAAAIADGAPLPAWGAVARG